MNDALEGTTRRTSIFGVSSFITLQEISALDINKLRLGYDFRAMTAQAYRTSWNDYISKFMM